MENNLDYEIPVFEPKLKPRKKLSADEMRDNFRSFYLMAVGYSNDEDLHWKDELTAIIHPDDYEKFNSGTSFVTNSQLEIIKEISDTKVLAYSMGYWMNGLEG